ncbi:hypothetical protein L0F63_000105 [Massospora cicadina]|nr:hypothetical protein L0F63_000105 [Massospora cicadina]
MKPCLSFSILFSLWASIFVSTTSGFEITNSYNSLRRDDTDADLGQSIPLTGSTFDLITQKGAWVVKFYAPWCPHCQRLAPFWKSLSEEFKEAKESSDFHFGEVDCDVEEGLRHKYEISGYPTILLFHDGKKVAEYSGTTNTDTELRPYIENAIVEYNSSKVEELEKIWYQLAEENPSFKLSHVDCKVEQKLCKSESVNDVPQMKLFKDGKFIEAYSTIGKRTVADLKEFVKSNIEINSATAESGSESLNDTWGTESESEENTKKHMTFSDRTSAMAFGLFCLKILKAKTVASDTIAYMWYHLSSDFSEFHSRYGVRFATVDCTLEKELCKSMGVGDKPSIQTFHLGALASTYNKSLSYDMLKPYIREQVYQLKLATKFTLHYFAKQRKPNPDGKLVMLQDNVFDMLSSSGPWFVFFKSNRCLDCRALESDWEKLATQFEGSVNIGMVQCSVETKLCNRLGISSYPYLRFFKDGVPRDYNGPTDLENLSRFTSAASMPQVHTVTKSSFPNIHRRESSYFLYIYDKAQDLEALEPILKGKYLLLDIYATTSSEYSAAGLIPPIALPHLQVFHNDISSASFSNALASPVQVQQWLATAQYPNVTALDSTNFDLIMEQNDVVALAVVDPLKDVSAIAQFDTAAIVYKPPNFQKKPTFASIDGIKWQEYIQRVYQKSPKDLPFVAILHPKVNQFKLTSRDGSPIPFHGDTLYKELDVTLTLPSSKQSAPPGLTFTTYILLLFLCGLALFLFISYRQRFHLSNEA